MGDLISLRRTTDQDYDLLVDWLDGEAGEYANGGPALCTGAELKAQAERTGHTYLMVATQEGETVGAVSWRTLSYPGNYSIGLIIGDPSMWVRGYGAMAFSALLRHLFCRLNAHRVEVTTGVYNKETMKIVTRGLMTLEGILRDYAFLDGEYHDVAICSLLRDEYLGLVDRGLLGKQVDTIPATAKAEALDTLVHYLADIGDKRLSEVVGRRRADRRASGGCHRADR